MSIDVSAVVAQFGAFYKPGSDNEKNLRKMLYERSNTAALFQDRPTADTIWRGTLASIERVVQPFQKAFTPIGGIVFTPNEFNLYKMKIDKSETPDDLESTFEGFLADMDSLDRAAWPFVRWLITEHIMPKKAEDLELNEYFLGEFAAPTPGTAGAVSTAMNGLRKVIRDYNTAARTNMGDGPIATGALAVDPADFCEQMEDFVEAMKPYFRKRFDSIVMSDTLARRYKRGKQKKYGLTVNFLSGKGMEDLATIEHQTNIKVVGVESMEGSELIFSTTKENRIRPVKKAALGSTMKVESLKREVFLLSDWLEALNFEVPDFVVHNDQDLA